MTESKKTIKKWYQKRRYRGIIIILFLIYFCFVPSRYKITPETTGIDNPIIRNGQVDYLAEYEKLYIDKLSPPEENGLRDMIAACGPAILEQMALVDAVPWEQMPVHEISKDWFEKQWIPLCEHMYIDPYKKPGFYDSRDFYFTMHKIKEAKKQEIGEENFVDDDPEDTKLWEKLVNAPWKAEDYPEVAQWMKDRSPLLDYFGTAVRKPNYVCWRQGPSIYEEQNPYPRLVSLLLPDVQAQRAFVRDLAVRVTERIGQDDFEGAWYDVMSMLHIGRHYRKEMIFVTNLVGVSCTEIGLNSAKLVLQSFPMTEERLDFMERTLNEIKPFSLGLNTDFEKMAANDVLQYLAHGNILAISTLTDLFGTTLTGHEKISVAALFPIDMNIAGKRLTELQNRVNFDGWADNPALTNRKIKEFDALCGELAQKLSRFSNWGRIPLIRTRSQMIAEWIFITSPALSGVNNANNRASAQLIMMQIAIELERYKIANGNYPENPDVLVPEYLDMVPLDPFTGRATFVYKLTPDSDRPYQFYSLGPNGKDDGSIKESRSEASDQLWEHDVVF